MASKVISNKVMNIQYSKKELRVITCRNILKMLWHQKKIKDVDATLKELGDTIFEEQIYVPILGESEKMARVVTFLSNANVTGQGFGDDVIQKAKAQNEWQVDGHIWILDKNQTTKKHLRDYFTIDTKNKVDEVSGGRISRKEKAKRYNIWIFEWYLFHADWFAKYVTPNNHTVESFDTLNKTLKREIKLPIDDRQAAMLNLKLNDRVTSARCSEMTGYALCSRVVVKK